jgi:hypothetical protein
VQRAIKGANVTAVNDWKPPSGEFPPTATDSYGAWDPSYAWGTSRKSGMTGPQRAAVGVVVAVTALAVVIVGVIGFVLFVADPAGAAGGCGGG